MIPLRVSVAHMRHNRVRALLTSLSVTVTVFLFCALQSVVTSLERTLEGTSSARLITQSAVSLFVVLPVHMWRKIEAVPGVTAVTHWTWFAGVWVAPERFFARFAVDVPSLRRVYGDQAKVPDMIMSQAEWDAFAQHRQGCVVGQGLVERWGFEVGSKIPLQGNIFPGQYDLTVVGVYRSATPSFDENALFFQWDYMNEVAGQPDRVGLYVLQLEEASRGGEVAKAVDELFSSSSTRTRTMTERAFQANFISMWGNLPLLMGVISGAVVFACFMITLNTMLLLARERVREQGIMKALGFSDRAVGALSVAESLLLCGAGTALGLGLAFAALGEPPQMLAGVIPELALAGTTVRQALGLGLLLGLCSGLVPFWIVSRLSVLDALRKVG